MRRKIVWRVVCIPKRAAKRVPPLPQVASPMEVICSQCRIVIRAHGSTKAGKRSYNSLGASERRDDLVGGTLMEAAGEPEEAFETCLTTVISLPRQLPVHQGQKGL